VGGANADPLAACQQRSDARAAGTIAHLGVELLTRGSGVRKHVVAQASKDRIVHLA
jgi:hypothetical protein